MDNAEEKLDTNSLLFILLRVLVNTFDRFRHVLNSHRNSEERVKLKLDLLPLAVVFLNGCPY